MVVFFVVFGLVLAAGLGVFALTLRNTIRTHRTGVLQPTGLQKATMWWTLLTIVVFTAILMYMVIGLISDPKASARWFAYFIVGFFPVSGAIFFMLVAARRQQRGAQQVRDREATLLFERIRAGYSGDRPLFVYLRPFSAVQAPTATESLVIELLEQRGALLCVDESSFQHGMGRIAFRDDEWQDAVLKLCECATAIVMYPAATTGTFWELSQLAGHGWLDRTIFFMPPHVVGTGSRAPGWLRRAFAALPEDARRRFDLRDGWEQARARAAALGVALPAYRDAGGLFRITAGDVDWITAFGREHRIGKAPQHAVEALTPLLDRLTAVWQSTHGAVAAGPRGEQVSPHTSSGAPP